MWSCIAGIIIIAAALGSVSKEQSFSPPILEAKFPLPSNNTEWLKDKQGWGGPPETHYSSACLASILAGRQPAMKLTEFSFVTIISAILCRICSFEALAGSHHKDLYSSFVRKMDKSLQVADRMLRDYIKTLVLGSTPTPLIHCAVTLLNSSFYHLYASPQLGNMKKLLLRPSILDDYGEGDSIFSHDYSPWLEKALLRAAEALRADSRLGLKYMKKVAPHRFAPLSATSCCEGGMSPK